MAEPSMQRILSAAEAHCARHNARLTPQRRLVLEILCAAAKPLSAYDILASMSDDKPPAPPVVYRALDFLLEQGLAHKLESLHAYVGCTHPQHPHASQFLICEACGDVSELENDSISRSLRDAASATGFKTSHPVVELHGTCRECSDKKPDTA